MYAACYAETQGQSVPKPGGFLATHTFIKRPNGLNSYSRSLSVTLLGRLPAQAGSV